MKIDIDERGTMILKEVFNSVLFETEEGEQLAVCMRDGAFEIAVLDNSIKDPQRKHYKWYVASSRGIGRQHLTAKMECGNDNSHSFLACSRHHAPILQ